MTSLPDARRDGLCSDCLDKDAETRDGRFCKKCLKVRIIADNPGKTRPTHLPPERRHSFVSDDRREPNGSMENAIRIMEGD